MPQPVPEDLVKVHLNFLLGTEEIAVSGFYLHLNRITGQTTDWPAFTQLAADMVLAKWKSNMQGARPNFPVSVELHDVSTYHLRASDGLTIDKGTAIAVGDGAWKGTATEALPNECAIAVSLYGFARGEFVPQPARRRGRMYLPPVAPALMDAPGAPGRAGRLSPTGQNNITQAIGAFFNDVHGMIGDLPGGDRFDVVIVSRAGNFFTPLVRVSVGDVMDVQRRRRNQQREQYQDFGILPSGQ